MRFMRFPKALKRGDTVALAATSSVVKKEDIAQCVKWLEKEGYRVKVSRCLRENRNLHGYLTGDGKSRAEDLNDLFADQEVRGIFCIRGGYGSAQMMRYLDFDRIRENPKVFVGYSDVTNLNIALNQFCDLVTFHGPMIYSNFLKSSDCYTKRELFRTIQMGEKMEFHNPEGMAFEVIREGEARGRIIGGNMSVLARGIGTFFQADTRGKILFLEDVNEKIASLDMILTQMEYAGLLRNVRGIVFGNFKGCENVPYDTSYGMDQFLRERMSAYRVPIMAHVQSGHDIPMGTIPMGTVCHMDTRERTLVFER